MARYFFHLRDGTDQILDPEGIELPSHQAVLSKALRCARDTLSNELLSGRLDLRHRIDVENSDGQVVHSLPLEQAFQTIRA